MSFLFGAVANQGAVSLAWNLLTDSEVDITVAYQDVGGMEDALPTFETDVFTMKPVATSPGVVDGMDDGTSYAANPEDLNGFLDDGILLLRATPQTTIDANSNLFFYGVYNDGASTGLSVYGESSTTGAGGWGGGIMSDTLNVPGTGTSPMADSPVLYGALWRGPGGWRDSTGSGSPDGAGAGTGAFWIADSSGVVDQGEYGHSIAAVSGGDRVVIGMGADASGVGMTDHGWKCEYLYVNPIGGAWTHYTDADLIDGTTPSTDPNGCITGTVSYTGGEFVISANGQAAQRDGFNEGATLRLALPAGWTGDGTQGVCFKITPSEIGANWMVALGIVDVDGDPTVSTMRGYLAGFRAISTDAACRPTTMARTVDINNGYSSSQALPPCYVVVLPVGATGDAETVGAHTGTLGAVMTLVTDSGGEVTGTTLLETNEGTGKVRVLLGIMTSAAAASDTLKFSVEHQLFDILDMNDNS